jgi:two-component system uhpT operon response regulator UhpA
MNIAIMDSNRIFSEALSRLFKENGHQVVATLIKPTELVEHVDALDADILIADFSYSSASEPNLFSNKYALTQKLKVIALSADTGLDWIEELFSIGVMGYISKSSSFADLLEGIEKVYNGHQFLSPDLERSTKIDVPKLTPQEKRVLALLTQGHSAKEIAELLKISVKTVYIHRARLIQKLGTKNLITLKRKASELGIWLNHHEQVTRFA